MHRLPQGLAGVAGFIRVVEHEQVEAVRAAAFEFPGGRHADEIRVLIRPAQFRIGETRIAAAALPLAL